MTAARIGGELRVLLMQLRGRCTPGILAERIPSKRWARIGVQGADLLLLLPPVATDVPQDVALQRLLVCFNVACEVEQRGNKRDETLVMIRMVGSSPVVEDAFIDIVALILSRMHTYEPAHLRAMLQALAQCFESLDDVPTKTLHGLFGELVVMDRAPDVDTAAAAWHTTPLDRHDFCLRNGRLEVKASCGTRQHTFSYEQLRPSPGITVVVASVLLESRPDGMSISDLLDRICRRLKSPETAAWVMGQAVKCMGDAWNAAARVQFAASGPQSVRYYAGTDVPCVKAPPFGVSMVRFKVDLQLSPEPDRRRLRALGPLAKAIVPLRSDENRR